MLGLLYTAAQCETKAETQYRLAISAKPTSYSATHNLAGLLMTQGKVAAARSLLTGLAAQNPALRERCMKQASLFDRLPPSAERAPIDRPWCTDRATLDKFLRSAPSLSRQAGELLRLKQPDMAEVFIKAALRADPTMVEAQLNLAQLELSRGRESRAKEILQEILAKNPEDQRAKQLLLYISHAPAPVTSPG